MAFPPSKICQGAGVYLVRAANRVSESYDTTLEQVYQLKAGLWLFSQGPLS